MNIAQQKQTSTASWTSKLNCNRKLGLNIWFQIRRWCNSVSYMAVNARNSTEINCLLRNHEILRFNQFSFHKGPFTPSVRVNLASTLGWHLRHSSHWPQSSCSKMVALHSQGTPLWSMRNVSQASSQRWRQIDSNAWCKRVLSGHSMQSNHKNTHFAKLTPRWPL